MTIVEQNYARFSDSELPERDVKTETYEPDTEEEYEKALEAENHIRRFLVALYLVKHEWESMPEPYRDELDGHMPNINPLDIIDDIRGAEKFRKELKLGLDAYERRT